MEMYLSLWRAPIDFILRGVMEDGEEVGLDLIPDYMVHTMTLASADFSSPSSKSTRCGFCATRCRSPWHPST